MRFHRDRATWLIYVQLGLWGYFLYGFGPVVPLLRDEQGTTAAVAGLHSTALAVGGLLSGVLYPPLSRRLGRARTMWCALGGVTAATILLISFRPLPVTLTAATLASMCGWTVVSCAVSALTARHGPLAPTAITEANAAAVGFGMISPLLTGLGVRLWDTWRPGIGALILLVAITITTSAVRRTRRPPTPAPSGIRGRPGGPAAQAGPGDLIVPAGPAGPAGFARSSASAGPAGSGGADGGAAPAGFEGSGGPPGSGGSSASAGAGVGEEARAGARVPSQRLPRSYWLAWSMLCVTGSIEVCLSLWAADVLRGHAGMSPGGASATVAAIVGGMFAGRLAGSRIALRVPPVPLLLAALGVSAIGFVLFWTPPVGWLAATGLIVLGFGNAMHYPLTISLALAAAPGQADLAAARANYTAVIGFGAAPLLLGALSDHIGPHPAFLLLPALIVTAALLTLRLRHSVPPRLT
ncbi:MULTISPECIES: MFS transporter [Catenuloplanes]|uniref:MFS family arabinose efflux permease n=1 Tax=Catenuloplanes niger TaxID=587534 RepID=A0AAE3ZSU8_9ACTN|nr:MFS transporter [Catenuloplanes niger]MDR7324306.1 putative MFS family arabinose efflux permease [Catenuloplanes niger]